MRDPDASWEGRTMEVEAAWAEQEYLEGRLRERVRRRLYRAAQGLLHPSKARDPELRAQGMSRKQEKSYEKYNEESAAEHEAFMAAGERDLCPQCGNRSVRHRTVCTLGYEGHPGADYSDYAKCERDDCDYAAL